MFCGHRTQQRCLDMAASFVSISVCRQTHVIMPLWAVNQLESNIHFLRDYKPEVRSHLHMHLHLCRCGRGSLRNVLNTLECKPKVKGARKNSLTTPQRDNNRWTKQNKFDLLRASKQLPGLRFVFRRWLRTCTMWTWRPKNFAICALIRKLQGWSQSFHGCFSQFWFLALPSHSSPLHRV